MWKNVRPVYGAGIRTHDLQNISLLSSPLDQGVFYFSIRYDAAESKINPCLIKTIYKSYFIYYKVLCWCTYKTSMNTFALWVFALTR